VYVQRFPISGSPLLISTQGGAQPRWRRDGRELFYVAPDERLMAADIKLSASLEAGSPHQLFQLQIDGSQNMDANRNQFDVSLNGQQFLVNTLVREPVRRAVTTVLLNWTAALKRQ